VTADREQPARRADSDDEEALPDAFWSVSRQLREASRDSLAPWDITPAQQRALRVLRHHRLLRLSELSDHLHIAARSGTEVTDALEARGLVRRRPDPADRRATLVELTEQGDGVLDAIHEARAAGAERVFDRLSQTDRAHLARILRKLRN